MVNTIYKVALAPAGSIAARPARPAVVEKLPTGKKIGRNDPCPCGKINPKTGKPMKYKRCHGISYISVARPSRKQVFAWPR